MQRIAECEEAAEALKKTGLFGPVPLPDDLLERAKAIGDALEEPGVKEVRVFKWKPRRRFPIPPRTLR